MNETRSLALAYLLISAIGLVWHMLHLLQLHRQRRRGASHAGLWRTLACRVLASVLYVGLGLVTFVNDNFPIAGLGVFAATQLLWQVNSWMDLRLQRQITKLDLERARKGEGT